MVMKYNQFKPLLGGIAGGFPFAGKPLGWILGGAWGAWLLLAVAEVRVVLRGWLGVRLFGTDSKSAVSLSPPSFRFA